MISAVLWGYLWFFCLMLFVATIQGIDRPTKKEAEAAAKK